MKAPRPKTPTKHAYEVVVFGGQLAGALTAALLSKRGYSVLVVTHDSADGWYEHGGYRWPVAPGLVPRLSDEPSLDATLTELGLHTVLQRQLKQLDLQLLEPRRRLTLWTDDDARQAELKRAGLSSGPIDECLEQAHRTAKAADIFLSNPRPFPPYGLIERWETQRTVKRSPVLLERSPLPQGPEPLPRLYALAPLSSYAAKPSDLSQTRAVTRLVSAPCTFKGGRHGLKEALLERARELGAEVTAGPVTALSFSRTGGTVRIANQDTPYAGAVVVGAADVQVIEGLLPEESRQGWAAAHPAPPLTHALFSHHVVLPAKALPRGLLELSVLYPSGEGQAPLVLHVGGARAAGTGEEVPLKRLTMHAVAPVALRGQGDKAIKAFVETLWAAAEEVLPFARPHVVAQSSVWVDCEAVAGGAMEPWPLYDGIEESMAGVCGVPCRTKLPRLVLASRQVLPGLGLEGEVLAARQACALVRKVVKRLLPAVPGRG